MCPSRKIVKRFICKKKHIQNPTFESIALSIQCRCNVYKK